MKKMVVFIVLAACVLVFALVSCSKDEVYNVIEKGVVAADINAAAENTEKINKLIKNMKKGDSLYFPEGIYYVESSGENGAINVEDKKNINIISNNATIVNTSFSPFGKEGDKSYFSSNIFNVKKSENISIEGFNIDYQNHINAYGKVVKTDGVSTYIEIPQKFFSDEKNSLVGGEYIPSVSIIDDNGVSESENYAPKGVGFSGKIDDIEKRIYKIEGVHSKVGRNIVMRFSNGETSAPMIFATNVSGLKIKNINVFSCPGNIFYAPCGSSDILIENVKAEAKDGNIHAWALNADGINTGGVYNKIEIRNCDFNGIAGDGVNVYNSACKVAKIKGGEVILEKENGEIGEFWAKKGDVVEFYNGEMQSVGSFSVKKFKDGRLKIDGNAKNLSEGMFVCNKSQLSGAEIDGLRINRGAKSGIIMQSDNAVIKNCMLKNLSLAAVVVAPDIYSKNELAPANNVTITDNVFENCCKGDSDHNDGIVSVKALQGQDKRTFSNVFSDIKILNNQFFNSGAAEIYMSAVSNYSIDGNKNEYGALKRDRIKLVNCEK